MSFDPVSFAMGKAAGGSGSGGGTDVSDTTATASDVLAGKYFHTADGTKTAGTIASQAAQTITPGTTDQTIAAGKYLAGAQTIKGDANLLAENIKQGVVIFGVTGTYAPAPTPTGHTVTFSVYNGEKDQYGHAYFKFDAAPSGAEDYDFRVHGGYDGASPDVYGSIVPGGYEHAVEDGAQYSGTADALYYWGDSSAYVDVDGASVSPGTWQSPTVIPVSANMSMSVTADSFDD